MNSETPVKNYRVVRQGGTLRAKLLNLPGFPWEAVSTLAPSKPHHRALAAANDLGADARLGRRNYSGAAALAMLDTSKDVAMRHNAELDRYEVYYRGEVWLTMPADYERQGVPADLQPSRQPEAQAQAEPDAFDPFSTVADRDITALANVPRVSVAMRVGGAGGAEVPGLARQTFRTVARTLADAKDVARTVVEAVDRAPRHLGRLEIEAQYNIDAALAVITEPDLTEWWPPAGSDEALSYAPTDGTPAHDVPYQMAQARRGAKARLAAQRESAVSPEAVFTLYRFPGQTGVTDDRFMTLANAAPHFRPAPDGCPVAWYKAGQVLQGREVKGGQDTFGAAQRYAVSRSQEPHNRGVVIRVVQFWPTEDSTAFVALNDGAARIIPSVKPPREVAAYVDGKDAPRYNPVNVVEAATPSTVPGYYGEDHYAERYTPQRADAIMRERLAVGNEKPFSMDTGAGGTMLLSPDPEKVAAWKAAQEGQEGASNGLTQATPQDDASPQADGQAEAVAGMVVMDESGPVTQEQWTHAEAMTGGVNERNSPVKHVAATPPSTFLADTLKAAEEGASAGLGYMTNFSVGATAGLRPLTPEDLEREARAKPFMPAAGDWRPSAERDRNTAHLTVKLDASAVTDALGDVVERITAQRAAATSLARAVRRFIRGGATLTELNTALDAFEVAYDTE